MHGRATNNLFVVKSNFALKLTNIRGKFRRLAGVTKKLTKIRCAKTSLLATYFRCSHNDIN